MEKTFFDSKKEIDEEVCKLDEEFFENHRFVITPVIKNKNTSSAYYYFIGEIQSREVVDCTGERVWVKNSDIIFRSAVEEIVKELISKFEKMAYFK